MTKPPLAALQMSMLSVPVLVTSTKSNFNP